MFKCNAHNDTTDTACAASGTCRWFLPNCVGVRVRLLTCSPTIWMIFLKKAFRYLLEGGYFFDCDKKNTLDSSTS